MATMNISLPQQMKDWVEAQTADGRYANASDFVRDIIRRSRKRRRRLRNCGNWWQRPRKRLYHHNAR